MANRKRNIQMKFYVTEDEKRLIDEKMSQLPTRRYSEQHQGATECRLHPLGETEQSETGRQDHEFPDGTRDKQLWRTGKQIERSIRTQRYRSCGDQADRKQKCRTYHCDEARRHLPSAKAAL